MAVHSSIRAWRIPWTEEPVRLQSKGHKELDTTEATEQALMHVLSPLKQIYYSPEFPIKYLGLKRFTIGKLRNPDLFCDLIEVTWWQESEFQ